MKAQLAPKHPKLRAEIGFTDQGETTINLYATASYRGSIPEALAEEVEDLTYSLAGCGAPVATHLAGGVLYVPNAYRDLVQEICVARGLL